MKKIKIENGASGLAQELSDLALRSKAFWPYDESFIGDCKEELRVSPELAGSNLLFVGRVDGSLVGFYSFIIEEDIPEMNNLFVDPLFIGKGFGKQLWEHAIELAKSKGWPIFRLCADPYAADKFYLPMGCQKIGEVKSKIRPDRKLPLLEFQIK